MAAHPGRTTTIVSARGQITLPKANRDRGRWSAGTRLTVEDAAEGIILRPAPHFPATTIDHVFGCLRHDGRPLALEELEAAVAVEAKRRARD